MLDENKKKPSIYGRLPYLLGFSDSRSDKIRTCQQRTLTLDEMGIFKMPCDISCDIYT